MHQRAATVTIEEFYLSIQSVLEDIDDCDIKIIMGDFKAKVGKNQATWRGVLGHHGIGETNERGQKLLQFCQANSLSVMNTWYSNKLSRKITWNAPENRTAIAP